MVRRGNLTDSASPSVLFYWAGAVAKLGLLPPGSPFQFADPAATNRLARNASMAWAIEPTVRERQLSDTRCWRSALLETYPSSTRTEGTSGAFSTRKPADFR